MLVTRVYGRHISLIQRQSHWREGGGIENGSVEQGPLGVGVVGRMKWGSTFGTGRAGVKDGKRGDQRGNL